MRRSSWKSKTVFLIILFIVLIIGGRYVFFGKTTPSVPAPKATFIIEDATSTSPVATSTSSSSKPEDPLSACVRDWQKKVTSEKTEYEKGTILVGFIEGESFEDAVKVLSNYGVVIRDMQYAKENYDSRRLITASVISGQEFTKLCTLKADASIRYTGLNVLFSLHD